MWRRGDSSEVIEVKLKHHASIQLKRKVQSRELSGTSKVELWQDPVGVEYYIKATKPRKIEDIFQKDPIFNALKRRRGDLLVGAVFNPYTEKPDNNQGKIILCSLRDQR